MLFKTVSHNDVDRILKKNLGKLFYSVTGIDVNISGMFIADKYDQCKFVYLEDTNVIIGMACIFPVKSMIQDNHLGVLLNLDIPKFANALYISNLIVHQDHQRKGYARQMILYIIDKFGKDNTLLVDTELTYLGRTLLSMGFIAQEEKFLQDCDDTSYLYG